MSKPVENIATRGKNYDRIYAYFMQHPFAMQKDCADDLGLSTNCVSKHYRKMHAKWFAQRQHERRRLKLIQYDIDVGEALLTSGLTAAE